MQLNIFGIMPEQLRQELASTFPSYRFKQLCDWLYHKLEFEPSRMTNIPKEMEDYLEENYSFRLPDIDVRKIANDGTLKLRLRLEDSALIEMVIIPSGKKVTLCVSSQVGCSRRCSFCATGSLGLSRNLHTHEIVGQIMLAAAHCAPQRLTNLVFMGMGEPLDNLDNVLQSLKIIQSEQGLAFSPRRTTVSTCGIPDQIRKLADSGIKTKLAVSLNAANDEKRSTLMPVNTIFPLPELKKAILYYLSKSNFRVTFEYILIPELNMAKADIKDLKKFAGDISCKINFIPYNQVSHLPYRSPTETEIEAFLKDAGSLNQAITLRRSRGAEVYGACGQLAAIKGE